MSHFPDLTPYTYGEDSDCLNVGWLETEYDFPTGEVSDTFLEKLAWACVFQSVMRTRGIHGCSFCPRIEHGDFSIAIGESKHLLGTAEIRVKGEVAEYAAPNLILHYCVDHDYQPPDDFQCGVLKMPDGLRRETWKIFRGPYWQ